MKAIVLEFSDFKSLALKKHIPVQERETENAFEVYIPDGNVMYRSSVFKESDTRYDAPTLVDYSASKLLLRVGSSIDKRADDGRVLVQPVTLDSNIWHRMTSYGDSAEHVGEGTPMCAYVQPGDPDVTIDVTFRDWIQIIGGKTTFQGGEVSPDGLDADCASLRVIVPSSLALTPNATMTGNAMVWANTVIPMANGPFDLDLSKACFVQADSYTGFWDWNWPDTGRGELRPNYEQKGEFHVITPDLVAVEFIGKSFFLGSGDRDYTPPNPHPAYIYPGYILRAEFHKISNGTMPLVVVSELQTARKSTV